jgi:hypothetical protein
MERVNSERVGRVAITEAESREEVVMMMISQTQHYCSIILFIIDYFMVDSRVRALLSPSSVYHLILPLD